MAGQRQKPYELLQNKRGDRRRQLVEIAPNLAVYMPVNPPKPQVQTARERSIDVAIAHIERQFGADAFPAKRDATPKQAVAQREGKRRYRPRGERKPNEARKRLAAARPRDEKGHFVKRERPQHGAA